MCPGPAPAGASLPALPRPGDIGAVTVLRASMLLGVRAHATLLWDPWARPPARLSVTVTGGHAFVTCGWPERPSTFRMKLANLSYK